MDKEWQDKGKIRCFRSHDDEKYIVDVNIIDRANSDKDRHEAIQALFQLFQSMAAVNARVMLNSVTMRRGLYLKNMAFKNEATKNKLLRQSEIGPKLFGGKCFVALYSSAENLWDAKETQHLRNLKQSDLKRTSGDSRESKASDKSTYSTPKKKKRFYSSEMQNKAKDSSSFQNRQHS